MEDKEYLKKCAQFYNSLGGSKNKNSRENMEFLIKKFNIDPSSLNVIHVAGTNGKGSFCEILSRILTAAGKKTALYVGPSMEGINDRFRINDEFISGKKLYSYVEVIRDKFDEMAKEGFRFTMFEALTLSALMYFIDEKPDFCIFEAGIGGLNDASNIFKKKEADVFMSISYDHTDVLGKSLEEIAKNKAGIIKEGDNVYIYPSDKEATDVFLREADKKNARALLLDEKDIDIKVYDENDSIFSYKNFKNLSLPLRGRFQFLNAGMALMLVEDFEKRGILSLKNIDINKALSRVRWVGRIEKVSSNPLIILDGSHNIGALDGFLDYLKKITYKKLILITSFLKDKNFEVLMNAFKKFNPTVIICEIPFENRSLDVNIIKERLNKISVNAIACKKIEDAYKKALSIYEDGDIIVGAGSLYLVSYLRDIIFNNEHVN